MDTNKETGTLIAFKVKKGVEGTERTRFFRALYGCADKSNYGRYTYKRSGVLDKIPHNTLVRAVVVVRNEDARGLIKFLSGKAELYIRKVVLDKEDKIALGE